MGGIAAAALIIALSPPASAGIFGASKNDVAVLAVRWARRSSRRAAFLGWGLQFLGAGVNPVPPPQV